MELKSLLAYADESLRPRWHRGGLYYLRHDEPFDNELNWTHMDPFSGNAAIGYARLNVEDGQRIMWENPWSTDDIASRPFIDFVRATWDVEEQLLILTMRSWNLDLQTVGFRVRNLSNGPWKLFVDGRPHSTYHSVPQDGIALRLQVTNDELDVVLLGKQ